MFSERSPSRSASSSRTGPPSAARERSIARASARSAAPTASSAAIETTVAGSASRHSAIPTAGPSAHGPTSRPSSPVRPLIPSAASTMVSSDGSRGHAEASSESGSFPSSIASTRQNARLRKSSPRPLPGAGGGTGGRCVSSRRLAWRRSPSASRQASRAVPASSGRPIHSGVSSTPSTSPPPTRSRYVNPCPSPTITYSSARRAARRCGETSRTAVRRLHRHVAGRAQRLDLERGVLDRGHAADAGRARVALGVDLVAPGRHHRAHVAAARAQFEPVGRALGARRHVARPRARAQREAAERRRGDRARTGADLDRRAHAREPHRAARGLDLDRDVVGHGQPVDRAAVTEHLIRAARFDAEAAAVRGAALHRRLAEREPVDAPHLDRRGPAVDLHIGVTEVEPDARQVTQHAVAGGARLARRQPRDRERRRDGDEQQGAGGDQEPPRAGGRVRGALLGRCHGRRIFRDAHGVSVVASGVRLATPSLTGLPYP